MRVTVPQWIVAAIFMCCTTNSVAHSASAHSTSQSLTYFGVPVPVRLAVGQELRLHFDESVELGLPHELARRLVVSSVHGILYLTANQSFETTRVAVKGFQSGRFTLLDLIASPAPQSTRDIRFKTSTQSAAKQDEAARSLSAAQILRFVAQQTLLPQPTKTELRGLSKRRVHDGSNFAYRSDAVDATVLSAWQSHQWLALAVELHNKDASTHELDPALVVGQWHSVAFRDTRLLPQGKRGARSILFVVGLRQSEHEVRD